MYVVRCTIIYMDTHNFANLCVMYNHHVSINEGEPLIFPHFLIYTSYRNFKIIFHIYFRGVLFFFLGCPPGTYGESCQRNCSCPANAFCDPETGDCSCLDGWIGDQCENSKKLFYLSLYYSISLFFKKRCKRNNNTVLNVVKQAGSKTTAG